MDDLDEDNISAEAGKQGLAELFHTQTNIKLSNHIKLQNVLVYKFLLPEKEGITFPPFPPKNIWKRIPLTTSSILFTFPR